MITWRYKISLLMLKNISYILEDIIRWREDMNFTFKWQEQYLTGEILFLPQEQKINIFKLIVWTMNIHGRN